MPLQLANQDFFRRFWPAVGPAVTAHRGEAAEEILPLIHRLHLRPGARILDVPCGYGRHALLLARRGYRVTGVDISAELLKRAREQAEAEGLEIHFRRGDMRRLGERRRYDVVLNLFTSFGYFGDAGDRLTLECFYGALRPGGRLAIHVANRDWIIRNYRPQSRVRMGDYVVEEKGRLDLASSVVHADWTARRGRRRWRGHTALRVYSCHELLRLLEGVGFREVKVFGGLRGKKLTLDSRWMTLIARR